MKTEGKLEIRPVEGANGPALLVSGTLTLDGVQWQVSAWLHRWRDSRYHVGLESDAPLFALRHALSASRVHWSKVDWEASTAVRRKLAVLIEAEVNAQAQAADCPTDNYLTIAIKHGFVKRERRGSHLYFACASGDFFEITPDHGWVLYFGSNKLKVSGHTPTELANTLSKISEYKGEDLMKKQKKQTQEAPIMIERTAAVVPALVPELASEPAPEPAAAAPAPEPVPVTEPTYQVALTACELAALTLLVKEGIARNKRAGKLCGFLAEHFIQRASASVTDYQKHLNEFQASLPFLAK